MVISPMQRERERETNYRAKKVHKTNIDLDSIFAKKKLVVLCKTPSNVIEAEINRKLLFFSPQEVV